MATDACEPAIWWHSRPVCWPTATSARWAARGRSGDADTEATDELYRRSNDAVGPLIAACRPGAVASDLLAAYEAAGEPLPPMPVAHGLGLGFDPPVVSPQLPETAAAGTSRPGHGARGHRIRLGAGRRRGVRPRRSAHHRGRTRGADLESVGDVSAGVGTSLKEDGCQIEPSAEEIILYEKDPKTKIATITFNRPEFLNAPTSAARLRYADLLRAATVDNDVKVVVIRGVGDNLGSGADLPEFMEGNDNTDLRLAELRLEDDGVGDVTYPPKGSFRHGATISAWYANVQAGNRPLQELKKISIVEAKGYCYGWHFYQCADADLVISSDDALFGHPSFRYYGWGPRMWTWVQMMGLRKFQEMVFTGRPFTAEEMYVVQLPQQSRRPRPARGRGGQVRARVRAESSSRHRLSAEDLLRGLQAAPGRVHGQPAVGLLRVDGQRRHQ